MRTVERRSLDVLITYPDGTHRVLEIDEHQHFNRARLTTLEYYAHIPVAFDLTTWKRLCVDHADDKHRPGYTVEKPPLFPGPGGRTYQRAFRDFLADALPPSYGWRPTARIARDEAETILKSAHPTVSLATLLEAPA